MPFALGMLRSGELSKGAAVYALFAVFVMTVTHFYTYRNGYLWCGRNEKVYKKGEPKRFVRWLVLHTLLLLTMFAIAVYTLLT
jgi:hypothetical protein